MSRLLEYQAYKHTHRGTALDDYQFVVDLAETEFRWFQVDLAGLSYLVEVQPGGKQWKVVLTTRGKTQVALEHISQLSVIHGTPVEQLVFTAALESAISQLTSN